MILSGHCSSNVRLWPKRDQRHRWASRMTLKPFAIGLIVASTLLRGGALAEDARRGATQITANYGVYWAGLHFGDIRLDITVRSSDYEMKGTVNSPSGRTDL